MDIKSMIAQAAAPHMQQINDALDALRRATESAAQAGFVVNIEPQWSDADLKDPNVQFIKSNVRSALSGPLVAELKYSATVREQG